jgi:hypothetical protein
LNVSFIDIHLFQLALVDVLILIPCSEINEKKRENNTYYLLLRNVCVEKQDAQEIMVYHSSTHLSHLMLFVSLSAQ